MVEWEVQPAVAVASLLKEKKNKQVFNDSHIT